jgi:hypothetical protein
MTDAEMSRDEMFCATVGKYTLDGYRIDGSKVRFFATKKQAVKAAKAIRWQLDSITKVHTRFQIGWAIQCPFFGFLTREGFGEIYNRFNPGGVGEEL